MTDPWAAAVPLTAAGRHPDAARGRSPGAKVDRYEKFTLAYSSMEKVWKRGLIMRNTTVNTLKGRNTEEVRSLSLMAQSTLVTFK